MLLMESVQAVNRLDEGFREQYQHRCHRKAKGVAKVAAARRLAGYDGWMFARKIIVAVTAVSMDGEAICFP